MAFDFLSYIVDQTQQTSQLFVTIDKSQRKSVISHIVSLQLMHLMGLDGKALYQTLDDDDNKLAQDALPPNKLTEFSTYLQQPTDQIKNANQHIANVLLNELQQLNNSAQLGESGLKELIHGQLAWIQQQVDDWFWLFINQTQHKITKTNKNDNPDFSQIMKDFNQIILNKEQSIEHHSGANTTSLMPNKVQNSRILDFLNPIIALIILYFLHNIIL